MIYKNIEELIYLGDGFYELETHEVNPYRWASDEFDLLINNNNIKTITLNVEFIDNLNILEIIGANLISKTNNQIQLYILDKIIKTANEKGIAISIIGKTIAENIIIENNKIAVRELIHINEELFPRKFS